MSDQAPAKVVEEGLPGWVMTFADLMSLLMCFFVLLLAFSELDVSKYKEMAGSMKNAFGVQREIKVREPPKGINIIAREFSPGRPEPTIMNVIRQMTTKDLHINIDLGKERHRPVPTPKAEHEPDRDKTSKPHEQAKHKDNQQAGLTDAQKKELEQAKKLAVIRLQQKLKAEQQMGNSQAQQKKADSIDQKSLEELFKARVAAEKRRKLEHKAKLISQALGREIKAGSVDVETEGQKIIIRVREQASFGSGRAELKGAFRPILERVANILKDSEGKIVIAGHTDNVPIYTERFRSNWELSAARAVSVAHEMMLATGIASDRFLVQGLADTKPMASNDTPAKRASNRRVEIILQQGEDKPSDDGDISGKKPRTGKAAVAKAKPGAKPSTGIKAGGH
ncbi:MAG: flagellar motor protein MotB [Pseudomonadota bacterium]|nr:flagellar motor protein MotB [Pseudomonadota bacterium]